tara:strand:- start:8675 stop:9181 length:507 start_codon:yes stop_codon:yes gene_type:complete
MCNTIYNNNIIDILEMNMTNTDFDYGILHHMVGLELRKAQALANQTFLSALEGQLLPGHYTVLVLIAKNPNQSQSRIAEAAGLDRSSLVPILKQFEKDDLIKRHPARHDRRAKIMTITPKGAGLITKYEKQIKALEQTVLSGLGPENHAKLVELLLAFQEVLKTRLDT